MKNILNNKGFTLVEVMVALLITGILMVIVFRFIFDQMHGYQREQKVADTQQNLRVVMDEMEMNIRMAGAGIPQVPISTGVTSLPNNVIYPLYIIQGPTISTNTGIFNLASSTASVNDSIIVIYQDPDFPAANGILTQDMPTATSSIIVTPSIINGGSVSTGFPSNGGNTPFIITDASGTVADLFMATGVSGNTLTVGTTGGAAAYNTPHSNFPASGYASGSRVFAVKVIRYDFVPAMTTFPITKMVKDDTVRGTDNEIGELFGASVTAANTAAANVNNNAMDIAYLPRTGATATTAFSQGMPTDPYNIGTVRITLTARTNVPLSNTFANNSLLRTRTLTTDIQLRNYN